MERISLISYARTDMEPLLREHFAANSMLNGDGIFQKRYQTAGGSVTIYLAEDYYFRINSSLTLTVIIEEKEGETRAEILSSGGKRGFEGLSFGAEAKAVNQLVKLFKDNGFQ